MPRLKPLQPTLRERKRYIVFRVHSDTPLTDAKEVMKAILNQAIQYMGVQGFARSGINFLTKYYSTHTQLGVIRVSNTEVNALKQAFARTKCIEHNDEKVPVLVHTVGVSGILKKARERYMQPAAE
jgi:RNase P/RNase MRP subunit POP5